MNENLIENKYVKIWMEDEIMHCLFKVRHLTLNAAKECVKTRIEFSSGKHHLVCVDMKNVQGMSKEARDFSSSLYARTYMKAGAIITNSPLNKMVVNFFLFVSQPSVPAQVFTNKAKAIHWLKRVEKNPAKYKRPSQMNQPYPIDQDKMEKSFWNIIAKWSSRNSSR